MMRGATHSPTLTATSMSVTGSPALKAMVREVQPHQRQGSALEYIHWLTEYLGSDSEDLAEFMHLLQKRTIKEITLAELIHAVKSLFAKYPPELIDRFRRFLPKNVRPLVDDNPVGSYTPMDVSVRIDDCESDRVAAAAEMARVPSFGSMTMYGGIGRGGGAVVDELDFMVAFKRMAWERFRIEGVLERYNYLEALIQSFQHSNLNTAVWIHENTPQLTFIFQTHPDLHLQFIHLIESHSAIIRHAARRRIPPPSPVWSSQSSVAAAWRQVNPASPVPSVNESTPLVRREEPRDETLSKVAVAGIAVVGTGALGVVGWFLYMCWVNGVCEGFF